MYSVMVSGRVPTINNNNNNNNNNFLLQKLLKKIQSSLLNEISSIQRQPIKRMKHSTTVKM